MSGKPEKDLDIIIDEALRTEPMRSAPPTLHRRVQERVRMVHLREQEQARFRYSMAALTFSFLAAIGMTALVVSFSNLDVMLSHGVAGGAGMLDYHATSMQLSALDYSGAYSLGISLLFAAATLVVGLIPLRRYFTTH